MYQIVINTFWLEFGAQNIDKTLDLFYDLPDNEREYFILSLHALDYGIGKKNIIINYFLSL